MDFLNEERIREVWTKPSDQSSETSYPKLVIDLKSQINICLKNKNVDKILEEYQYLRSYRAEAIDNYILYIKTRLIQSANILC